MFALSLVAISILALAFSSLSGISKITGNMNVIAHELNKKQMAAANVKTEFVFFRLMAARVAAATLHGPKAIEVAVAAQDAQQQKLQQTVASLQKLMTSDLERRRAQDFANAISAYGDIVSKVNKLRISGQNDLAEAVVAKEVPGISEAAAKSVDDIQDYLGKTIEDAVVNADDVASNANTIMIVVSVISITLAVLSMAYTVFGVANPIGELSSAVRVLAGGSLEKQVPFTDRRDELGQMAIALEVLRKSGLENIRLQADAAAARQAQEAQSVDMARRTSEEAQKLRFATQTLGDGLRRLAAGDVSFSLSEPFAPEYEELRTDFNETVRQLGDTISSVLSVVHSIESGTAEIAGGANDLSKRTEQQAASLEETAAALDEITQNVSMAAKRTDEARQVASRANANAESSVRVVADAEEAMRRIEESSQQISNIIGVIDEIAFQTNLLALNAGVEAARAGEAGKGFAVVAQEVRELAQRSANAAKEIKGLILNSSNEVENGVKLVRDTGSALKEIGSQVVQVNQLMETITTSSREQSAGLAEVNTAVNHMDQTTQQNAAMVEQSTAASSALANEAGRLRELVGRFRLPQDAGRGGQGAVRRAA
ncbi:methyl-accepting chemotaxis protein [Rhizobium helianthi]|uniref:Methyl-accepting chemotaxis protein n=1 Tax=Rhizobium helianthi TaxID=1132695 RepID=A0ABW4M3G1_9HYPH